MSIFDNVKNQDIEKFVRDVGISQETFIYLLEKVSEYIQEDHKVYPRKTRGQKPSICLEDKLLLTLYYLRDYPTFMNLGKTFGISESYANKIYHSISNILMKLLELDNRKELLNKMETILIDVSEQPIERPKKNQKLYYSGKKNAIQ